MAHVERSIAVGSTDFHRLSLDVRVFWSWVFSEWVAATRVLIDRVLSPLMPLLIVGGLRPDICDNPELSGSDRERMDVSDRSQVGDLNVDPEYGLNPRSCMDQGFNSARSSASFSSTGLANSNRNCSIQRSIRNEFSLDFWHAL